MTRKKDDRRGERREKLAWPFRYLAVQWLPCVCEALASALSSDRIQEEPVRKQEQGSV